MNSSFTSILSEDIQTFINMKRSLGYKYVTEEYILLKFDKYWEQNNGNSDSVTMESLAEWVKQQPTEGKSSQYSRIHIVKQFLLFRNSLGKFSYIPMDKIKCSRRPVIHILSQDEINALFLEIDSYKPSRPSPQTLRISKEYPVLFRLILTTGLRRTEAVSIRIADLNTNEKTIIIRNAKGHKDRIISISKDMTLLLEEYMQFLNHTISETTEWLFPAVDMNTHLSSGTLALKFNSFWSNTKYADACSKKPTLHSLRHTFVVLRINAWIENDIDTAVMLPYLSRHLGHKSAEETFYYYHQVIDSLKVIQQKDSLSSLVIPEVRTR